MTALSSFRLENLSPAATKHMSFFFEPKDLERFSLASKTTRIALDSFFLETVILTLEIFPKEQVALWEEDIKNLTFSTYPILAQRVSQFLIESPAFDTRACNIAIAIFNDSIFKGPAKAFFKNICVEKEFERVALLAPLGRSTGLLRLTQQLISLDLSRAESLPENMEECGVFRLKSQAIELIINAYLSKAHKAKLAKKTEEFLVYSDKAESLIDSLTFPEEQKEVFREAVSNLRIGDTKEIGAPYFLRRLPPVNSSSWV